MVINTSTKQGKFEDLYQRACQLSKTVPLSTLLTRPYYQTQLLQIPADKVLLESDWFLVLNTLPYANNLKGLCVWSHWWWEKKIAMVRKFTNQGKVPELDPKNFSKKIPLILTLHFTESLIKSFTLCLKSSLDLTALCLDGILLNPSCIRLLSDALLKSSITTLSLIRCEIGDQGFVELVPFIKYSKSLIQLDLSDNELTQTSAELLKDALKTQSLRRVEAGFPNLLRTSTSTLPRSSIPLLTRLTLNGNVLSDKGVYELLDALRDEIGMQVVELQRNQITSYGAHAVQVFLKEYPKVFIDIRKNDLIDPAYYSFPMAFKFPPPIFPTPSFPRAPSIKPLRQRPLGPRKAWRPAGIARQVGTEPAPFGTPSSSTLFSSSTFTLPPSSTTSSFQPHHVCEKLHEHAILKTKIQTLEKALKETWQPLPPCKNDLKVQAWIDSLYDDGKDMITDNSKMEGIDRKSRELEEVEWIQDHRGNDRY